MIPKVRLRYDRRSSRRSSVKSMNVYRMLDFSQTAFYGHGSGGGDGSYDGSSKDRRHFLKILELLLLFLPPEQDQVMSDSIVDLSDLVHDFQNKG